MRILIRLPNWLGDCVMATPAIESLKASYENASFTLVGSHVALGLFARDSRIEALVEDESKKAKCRTAWLFNKAKELGSFDIAITFQNSFLSALFLYFTGSSKRVGYAREFRSLLLTDAPKEDKRAHQTLRYLELVAPMSSTATRELCLIANGSKESLCLINPGAAYGEAKRWGAEKFAKVAAELSKTYDIAIVGAKNEEMIGFELERGLLERGISNYTNLVGKTSVPDLMDLIASAKLFITNDSGPMHIAAAFRIPTVAIFGPTDERETGAWNNENFVAIKKDMSCRPCKKRICPLTHHDCMRLIEPIEVISAAKNLLNF